MIDFDIVFVLVMIFLFGVIAGAIAATLSIKK